MRSSVLRRLMKGPPEDRARWWNRRMKAQDRYRRRRDRKIPVDWIGKEFQLLIDRDRTPTCSGWTVFRVVGYHPANHTIDMAFGGKGATKVTWSTDEFWSMCRAGSIRQS